MGPRSPARRREPCSSSTDVTELRRLERMRQDFVANASHELKTPVGLDQGLYETLLDWALQG